MGRMRLAIGFSLALLGVVAAVALGSQLTPSSPEPASNGLDTTTEDSTTEGTTTEDTTTEGTTTEDGTTVPSDDDGTPDQGPGDAPGTVTSPDDDGAPGAETTTDALTGGGAARSAPPARRYQTNRSITRATSSPGTGPIRSSQPRPSGCCVSRALTPASSSSLRATVARRLPSPPDQRMSGTVRQRFTGGVVIEARDGCGEQ